MGAVSTTAEEPRSWRVRRLGTPDRALVLEQRPPRAPGTGEVRVRVAAIGLNHPDLLVCAGRYQERPGLPFSPGFEAAGTVAAVGPGTSYRVGERVLVVPELPEGAMQESLTVPEEQVFPVPATMPPTTAAVLHIAWTTAHVALHHRARLRAGETVLVTGAAGGVGTAAVQLARAAGARVLATATGAAHADACRELGAEVVLDPADPGLPGRVRDLTAGRGVDVVVDVVGGELFDRLRRCVAFEGRLVTVGFTSGALPAVPVNHVLLRNYSVVGLHLAPYRRHDPALLRRVHDELVRLHAAGVVVPPVTEVPFERAPEALDMLARREVVGRVVLRC